MKIIPLLLALLVMPGCIAGGIGQFHKPSENYYDDSGYNVTLRLIAPGGNAKRGFKSAQMVIADLPPFDMNIMKADKHEVIFSVTIKERELPRNDFRYYFTFVSSTSGIHVFRPENSDSAFTATRSKSKKKPNKTAHPTAGNVSI
jgi:hypothetical protein